MKILRTILICLFWCLILALLVSPLFLIYRISQREMQRYMPQVPPSFRETSYGAVVSPTRRDVTESYMVSGRFISGADAYMELTQERPERIRWDIAVGDEVQEDAVIGWYEGTEIRSTQTGIVREICASEPGNAYVKVELLEPLLFECDVTPSLLTSLRHAKELSTGQDEPAELVFVSNIKNADGTFTVRLSVESDLYAYGEEVPDMILYTGNSYLHALVLPLSCVYQKVSGAGQPWYVREVDRNGFFLREIQVECGFSDGTLVCVTGLETNQYFDSGYKSVVYGG